MSVAAHPGRRRLTICALGTRYVASDLTVGEVLPEIVIARSRNCHIWFLDSQTSLNQRALKMAWIRARAFTARASCGLSGRVSILAGVRLGGHVVVKQQFSARRTKEPIVPNSPFLQPVFQRRTEHSEAVLDAPEETNR